MKDILEETLRSSRPKVGGKFAVQHCLHHLYKDNKHCLEEEIVKGLTFEELIGALLLAQDEFDSFD